MYIGQFRFEPGLFIFTLLYLLTPQAIFALGWYRQPWNTLIIALLLLALASALNPVLRLAALGEPLLKPSRSTLIGLLIVSGGLILISGIGGYGFQHFDWDKHNQILQDLITEPWPVSYPYYDATVGLVYYIAYYLPAAVAGKWSGWNSANSVLALWSWIGLALAMIWFGILVGRRPLWIAMSILLLFSGLDILGSWLTHSPIGAFWPEESFPTEWSYWVNLDGWTGKWQYSSSIKLIFAVPNQALAGWLATALVAYSILKRGGEDILLLVWGATALWSPFVTLGLAPFVIVAAFVAEGSSEKESSKNRLLGFVTLPNVAGLVLLASTGVFFASKLAPIPPIGMPELRNQFVFLEFPGWQARLRWMAMLLIFWLVELALWAWIIHMAKVATSKVDRGFVALTLGILFILPFWAFGAANDLVMRASIPALFMLAIWSARSLFQLYDRRRNNANPKRRELAAMIAAAILLVMAALNPLQEIALHVTRTMERGTLHSLDIDESRNLVDAFYTRPERLFQYIASTETFFFRSLSRPLTPATEETASQVVKFGDGLMLIDHEIETRWIEAGDSVDLTLTLETIAPLTENLSLAIRLVSQDGTVVWEEQSWPSGRATKDWQPFHRYYDSRTITTSTETPAGALRVDAYFFNPDTDDKLIATKLDDGAVLGDVVAFDYLEVGEPQTDGNLSLTNPVQFGDAIAIVESTLEETVLTPGDKVNVNLVWQALDQPAADLVLSLQVLDTEGRLAVQTDTPLLQGFIPTRLWQPSLRVEDQISLQLARDAEPGDYSIWLVLYDPDSGLRLPISQNGSGQGDALTIGQIQVVDRKN